MSQLSIRIATRKSPLAVAQALIVQTQLQKIEPNCRIELVKLSTKGDEILDKSLTKIGGKGLFIKELENAMLANHADIAVHSMKDMPAVLPEGLCLAAILAREDMRDALISKHHGDLMTIPNSGSIGTSSLRRQCQLKALRPDITVHGLRGNINTRLEKASQFDAIILAAAGLKRLNMQHHITHYFEVDELLPAAGQGAIGIECRKKDRALGELLKELNCQQTHDCIMAERALIERLDGNCQVPIGAYAHLDTNERINLKGLVGSPDGQTILTAKANDTRMKANELGYKVANELLEKGAKPLLLNNEQIPR